MEIAKLILEYLKAVTSPQIIAGAVAVFFLLRYGTALKDFLGRVTKWDFKGLSAEAAPPAQMQVEIRATSQSVALVEPTDQLNAVTVPENQIQRLFQEPLGQNPEVVRLQQMLNVAQVELQFERILNIIFGTQLALIGHLSRSKDLGETWRNVFARFYQEHLKISSRPVEFTAFLGFLEAEHLIERGGDPNDPTLRLTLHGGSFVSYVASRYPGITRPL